MFLQTEIDARAERTDSVRDFGLGLIRSAHSSKAEIQKALNQLEEAKSSLDRAWMTRSTTLEQARTLQVTSGSLRETMRSTCNIISAELKSSSDPGPHSEAPEYMTQFLPGCETVCLILILFMTCVRKRDQQRDF